MEINYRYVESRLPKKLNEFLLAKKVKRIFVKNMITFLTKKLEEINKRIDDPAFVITIEKQMPAMLRLMDAYPQDAMQDAFNSTVDNLESPKNKSWGDLQEEYSIFINKNK